MKTIPNSITELRKFVSDHMNDMSRLLCLNNYPRGCSTLHKNKSKLVRIIDNRMRKNGVSSREAIFQLANGISSAPKCKMCSNTVVLRTYGYSTYCSVLCRASDPDWEEKRKQTSRKKFGTDYALQSETVKKKSRRTLKKRFGVENASQAESVKEQKRQTSLSNYGVDHPLSSKEVRDKIRNTHMRKRGVEHPMHDPDIFSQNMRSRFTPKSTTINGVRFANLQGYEPDALNYLVNEKGFGADQIVTHPKKTFKYKDSNGNSHVYHPDIQIRGKKHIIEVKSPWTFKGMKGSLEENRFKKESVVRSGYRFSFLIIRPGRDPVWKTYKPSV